MASESVRAVLNHVWNTLEPLGYPCALVGGIALAAWNHPRATRDVDLLIAVDRTAIEPVVNHLQSAGCRGIHQDLADVSYEVMPYILVSVLCCKKKGLGNVKEIMGR